MSDALEQPIRRKADFRPRSRSTHRTDADLAAGTVRIVRALGRRLAEDDPDNGVLLLRRLDREVDAAWRTAVAGWRASGFSDVQIGDALGVTPQAVGQRFPRGRATTNFTTNETGRDALTPRPDQPTTGG
jgi:hypothetical protein